MWNGGPNVHEFNLPGCAFDVNNNYSNVEKKETPGGKQPCRRAFD
jgi:hypothetical protein